MNSIVANVKFTKWVLSNLLIIMLVCFSSIHQEENQQGSVSIFGFVDGKELENGLDDPMLAGILYPELFRYLDTTLHELVESNQYPAVSVMAAKDSVLFYENHDGYPKGNEIFRLYSQSKPLTAVATLILIEDGKLTLDTPVENIIPEIAQMKVYLGPNVDPNSGNPNNQNNGGWWGRGNNNNQNQNWINPESQYNTPAGYRLKSVSTPMTIRHLLTHTSGLAYGEAGTTVVDRMYREANMFNFYNQDLEMWIQKLVQLPLASEPGGEWRYGLSFDVLGLVIQRVSGIEFSNFLQQRLFDPLEMYDTGFYVKEENLNRFPIHYIQRWGQLTPIPDNTIPNNFKTNPPLKSGGGGIVSTTRDFTRFGMMLANGGELNGVRILSEEMVYEMLTNQLRPDQLPYQIMGFSFPGTGFGYGVSTRMSAGGTNWPVGEISWGGAAGTNWWMVPSKKLMITGLTQKSPFTNEMSMAVRTWIYAAVDGDLNSLPDTFKNTLEYQQLLALRTTREEEVSYKVANRQALIQAEIEAQKAKEAEIQRKKEKREKMEKEFQGLSPEEIYKRIMNPEMSKDDTTIATQEDEDIMRKEEEDLEENTINHIHDESKEDQQQIVEIKGKSQQENEEARANFFEVRTTLNLRTDHAQRRENIIQKANIENDDMFTILANEYSMFNSMTDNSYQY